jgi:hypothetical protein
LDTQFEPELKILNQTRKKKTKMDGDSSAKTLDSGANSALRSTEGSDSIHEASHQAVFLLPSLPPFSLPISLNRN